MTDTVPRRPNRFEIDLTAVAHNLREVRRLVGPSTRIFGALKADAYGFGLGEVADTAAAGHMHDQPVTDGYHLAAHATQLGA